MTAILNPTGPAPLIPPPRRAPEPAVAPAPGVPVGPVLELPGTPAAALVPVTRDGRAVGAFGLAGGRVRYRSLPDPDQVLAAAAGVVAAALLTAAVLAASRRRGGTGGTGLWSREGSVLRL
ncbi:hypothetical protein ABZ807_31935 [Micromonospora sp. NPDC047548]|uniref:hypothetical protein n=1 Tax=Micromonospora sp. NPDC047548 TaxID=3155624 RepID=UPI0033D849F4